MSNVCVCIVVLIHSVVNDFPPFLIRASNGMDDLVLNAPYHPLRDGRVFERDVARDMPRFR